MKKFFLLVVILFTTTLSFSQTIWRQTDLVNLDYGYGYTGWQHCVANVKIDIDNDRIVIYTQETQIFDIETLNTVQYSNYKLLQCVVNDSKYVRCYMDIYIYNYGNSYIKLTYSNIVYKYRLK